MGLFTSFAPSQDGSDRCAVVTREKRLHIQGLAEVDTHPATQTDIQNYRVVKLMMGWDNQRIFAIGKTQASDKLLLLEMKTPGQSTRNVSVRELAQLPGLSYRDVFVERAVFGKDENYVLIAAMMAANQCVIYKVRLPPLDVTGGSSN